MKFANGCLGPVRFCCFFVCVFVCAHSTGFFYLVSCLEGFLSRAIGPDAEGTVSYIFRVDILRV